MTCETCRYWKKHEEWLRENSTPGDGTCRRFPAAVLTNNDDWCGEYQRDPAISETEGRTP